MEISILLKVVGVGLLVAVSGQILSKTGRDELTTWITVAGIVLVLVMLLGQIGQLFSSIRSLFGI
jgi:stage III sporulation protein AC